MTVIQFATRWIMSTIESLISLKISFLSSFMHLVESWTLLITFLSTFSAWLSTFYSFRWVYLYLMSMMRSMSWQRYISEEAFWLLLMP